MVLGSLPHYQAPALAFQSVQPSLSTRAGYPPDGVTKMGRWGELVAR